MCCRKVGEVVVPTCDVLQPQSGGEVTGGRGDASAGPIVGGHWSTGLEEVDGPQCGTRRHEGAAVVTWRNVLLWLWM